VRESREPSARGGELFEYVRTVVAVRRKNLAGDLISVPFDARLIDPRDGDVLHTRGVMPRCWSC